MTEPIQIALDKGYVALVDPIDADLADFRWHANIDKRHNNYIRVSRGHNILMHRVILERVLGRQLERNELVDHADHDTLNNQRSNLRLAVNGQNRWNSKLNRNSTSGYKGVTWHKRSKTWDAYLQVNLQAKRLGSFDTAIEAAIAYNHAARKYFGEFALLNDIPEWETITPKPRLQQEMPPKNNTSGYVGINWNRCISKWQVRISVKGVRKFLGYFDGLDEARAVYDQALHEYYDQLRRGKS